MELEKSFNNGYGYITLTNSKKKLTIEYAPNLDLYFVVEDTSEFVITKEDYQIYELFSKLYETIISADVFNQSSFDYYMSEFLGHFGNKFISYEDYLKKTKKSLECKRKQNYYAELVNNGKIVWKCDDYPHDIGPSFEISKCTDIFKITFDKGDTEKQDLFHPKNRTTVRIRTSGSAYNYFYIPFMMLFKELIELVLIDQIHIEEYLYTKKLK